MATIDNPRLIVEVIEHDGQYEDDPLKIIFIHSYINQWGNLTYLVTYEHESLGHQLSSPYVNFPLRLWDALNGLTKDGQEFLDDMKSK